MTGFNHVYLPVPDLKKPLRQKTASVDLSKLDRLPPHSIEAEQGVLGCILLSPSECINLCLEKVKPHDDVFYDLRHQELFSTLVRMQESRKPIDLITVQQELHNCGKLEGIGGLSYLSGLMDAVPSAANLAYYLDIIREKHVLRRMLQTCTGVLGRVHDHEGEVDALMESVEKEIMAIRDLRITNGKESRKQSLIRVTDAIINNSKNKGATIGLATGIPKLDGMINGWRPGRLYVLAALSKWGKSSLALQTADYCAAATDSKGNHTCPVAYFSLEMPRDELNERSLGRESDVPSHEIQNPSCLNPDDAINESDKRRRTLKIQRLRDTNGAISKWPLLIVDEPGIPISKMRAAARRMVVEDGVKLIVVDYLQLMEGTTESRGKNSSREREISSISKGLKDMAMELKVPVIALAQLNREFEKSTGRKPKLSDLRESGSIGQDADCVIFLYGNEDQIELPIAATKCLVAAQRGGATGEFMLTFNKPLFRFEAHTHKPLP